MTDEKDAEYAMRKLDGMTVGYKRRPLKIQWAKVGPGAVEETALRVCP